MRPHLWRRVCIPLISSLPPPPPTHTTTLLFLLPTPLSRSRSRSLFLSHTLALALVRALFLTLSLHELAFLVFIQPAVLGENTTLASHPSSCSSFSSLSKNKNPHCIHYPTFPPSTCLHWCNPADNSIFNRTDDILESNAYGKDSFRKSLPAKTRQSSGAIIPQVPYSWVQSQQSEQLDQQQQQQQQLENSTKKSVSSSSRQSFRDSEHQHHDHQQQQQQQQYQQEDAFRQQYYQQQFLQQQTPSTGSAGAMEVAQYRTPLQPQGSASPHRRGMSAR